MRLDRWRDGERQYERDRVLAMKSFVSRSRYRAGLMVKPCPCGCGRVLRLPRRRMARRAVEIEQSIRAAERMRDRFGEPWAHAVEQGRMFSRTYLALAHRERGGVSSYLESRQTRFKFHRNARDWMTMTLRAAATLQSEDAQWRVRRAGQ